MRVEKMTQELVEATSRLIGGRTINIMDTNGIIISSTEKNRIGTIHEGAREVIRSRHAVAISKDEVNRYPGAREGYNVPVYSGNNLIAVVGIFGDPEKVCETANLLAVYTAKCIEQNALAIQQQIISELRLRYLNMLLSLSANDDTMLASLSSALCICQKFPVRVFIIHFKNNSDTLNRQRTINNITENLLVGNFLKNDSDVWGAVNNDLVIIKDKMGNNDDKYINQIYERIKGCIIEHFQICVGGLSYNSAKIKKSYEEALVLCHDNTDINDITKAECKFRYMMHNTYLREKHCIEEIYEKLETAVGNRELDNLMKTAFAYYDENGSVKRASEKLHIHKNTLQYRMHKIWNILGLNDSNEFIKEYFVRLCLLHYKCK